MLGFLYKHKMLEEKRLTVKELLIRSVKTGDEKDIFKNLFTNSEPENIKQDIQNNTNNLWLVGEYQKEVIATIILVPNSHILHQHIIEFCSLVVAEKYRKLGIGTKMILEAKKIAKEKGYEIITASARHDSNSISLFIKNGFIQNEFIKKGIKQPDGKYFDHIKFIIYL